MTVRLLTPGDRPRPPLPKWVRVALAVGGTGQLFGLFDGALSDMLRGVAIVVGLIGSYAFGTWLEQRFFLLTAGGRPLHRIGAAMAAPVAGLFATTLLMVPAGLLAYLWAPFSALVLLAGVTGLTFALAACGSVVIVLIDTVISAFVREFRARVLLAVFTMLSVSGALAMLLSFQTLRLLRELAQNRISFDFTPTAGQTNPDLLARVDWIVKLLVDEPELVMGATFGLALLFGAPAVLSACGKLADAVMERLHPLATAMDELAEGKRDMRVEEQGSDDFVRISRRFNQMVDSLQLAERMERAFGMYVSGQVMQRIRAQHGEALLPASMREATVFFADIRGFTAMSERLAPEPLVALMNRYFEQVVAVVNAHDGYLNKFIGDAVVVVFNGPIDQTDHAERAVRCAIALQQRVAEMNAGGLFPEVEGGIRVGVGIASGPMVCGNVGGARQVEYTVMGDTVNLAARLTSQAGAQEILINDRGARALPEEVRGVALPPVQVKGKADPVVPWKVWPRQPSLAASNA